MFKLHFHVNVESFNVTPPDPRSTNLSSYSNSVENYIFIVFMLYISFLTSVICFNIVLFLLTEPILGAYVPPCWIVCKHRHVQSATLFIYIEYIHIYDRAIITAHWILQTFKHFIIFKTNCKSKDTLRKDLYVHVNIKNMRAEGKS